MQKENIFSINIVVINYPNGIMQDTNTQNVKWLIFLVSATGGFLAMLDSNTINVALYEIAKDFNADINAVQWVVTGYILILSSFLMLFGKLNDVVNRRILYTTGFLVFAGGSILNILSFNLPMLILCRLIQSLGASILLSNNIAIISSVFKGKKRAKAIGFSSAMMALSGMTGPAIGGFLMHYFGWRGVFIPGVIVAVSGAVLSSRIIPAVLHKEKFKFDYLGMVLLFISTFSMLLIISKAHTFGVFSLQILVLFFIMVVFGALFYFRENKIDFPIVDFELFKMKIFLFGNFAMLISYFALFSNAVMFPYYAQVVMKASPLQTALLMLPFSVCFMFAAMFNGKLSNKYASGLLMTVGAGFIILGLLLFSTCGFGEDAVKIILAQMLMGTGSGIYQPSANITVMNSAPINETGMASGILAMFRNTGMLLGIMISLSVFDTAKAKYGASGINELNAFVFAYRDVLLVGAVFAIVCLFLSFRTYREKIKMQKGLKTFV